jgi:hypothetical protein
MVAGEHDVGLVMNGPLAAVAFRVSDIWSRRIGSPEDSREIVERRREAVAGLRAESHRRLEEDLPEDAAERAHDHAEARGLRAGGDEVVVRVERPGTEPE